MTYRRKTWYRIDSAAKIFPAIVTNRSTTVFRLSATLKDTVAPDRLQQALDQSIERFPGFKVRLRAGLFWNYFQEVRHTPLIQEERYAPCRPMHMGSDRRFLFRVLYYQKRIALECAHVLTDGTGAQEFLLLLLQKYLQVETPFTSLIAPDEPSSSEEWEDGYLKYYKPDIPPPRRSLGAYHLPKPLTSDNGRIITARLSCTALKNLAKENGVTITEYLVATWLASLQDLHESNPRRSRLLPLRVMVPVNLRAMYPSKTLRNFFLTVLPGIDLRLGEFTFREILDTVHHYMQVEVNEKYINQQIRQMVDVGTLPLIKWLPLMVKAPFNRIIYRYIATRKHSGVMTNLGLVRLPEEARDAIERFDFIPNPNPITKANVGIISYGEWTTITVGTQALYKDVERLFFTRLRKVGLAVRIETNEKEQPWHTVQNVA
ncbi:MAG: hypothetical protein JXR25_01005 [Pontiellaceae bacterium]|nr:hypothetical protein [Pontiellaceae bacterium]MBN2783377.1 hypothetical protein [Pontiellaceae bacterium]